MLVLDEFGGWAASGVVREVSEGRPVTSGAAVVTGVPVRVMVTVAVMVDVRAADRPMVVAVSAGPAVWNGRVTGAAAVAIPVLRATTHTVSPDNASRRRTSNLIRTSLIARFLRR